MKATVLDLDTETITITLHTGQIIEGGIGEHHRRVEPDDVVAACYQDY